MKEFRSAVASPCCSAARAVPRMLYREDTIPAERHGRRWGRPRAGPMLLAGTGGNGGDRGNGGEGRRRRRAARQLSGRRGAEHVRRRRPEHSVFRAHRLHRSEQTAFTASGGYVTAKFRGNKLTVDVP